MISKEVITKTESTEIAGTIIIDLEDLEAIHKKAVENDFSDTTYYFKVYDTKYTCNDVEEISAVLSDNRLTKINNLSITYSNRRQTISVDFTNDSLSSCVIRQSEVTTASSHLAKEIFYIINAQNRYTFKKLSAVREYFFNIGCIFLWLIYGFAKFNESLPAVIRVHLLEIFIADMLLLILY